MNDDIDTCEVCKKHTGHVSDLKHLSESDTLQWVEINKLKTWLIATLTTSLLTLIGVIINVAMSLPKQP